MTTTSASILNDTAATLAQRLPPELTTPPQWVAWRVEVRDGKKTKVPYSPVTNERASSTDPATWTTLDVALDYARRKRLDGVGYVFASTGAIVGIDLDHCRNSDTGSVELWALELVNRFASYTEVSPSGTGLHIFVRGTLPPTGRRKGRVECYDRGRYFTVTADRFPDTPLRIEDRASALLAWHREVFGEQAPAPVVPSPNGQVDHNPASTKSHHNGQSAVAEPETLSDTDLLARMVASTAGLEIDALWRGQWSGNPKYPSQSEADLALCNHLAYWTNRDVTRMDRLFRQSRLYRPGRWESGYSARTVQEAIAGTPTGWAGDAEPVQPVSLTELGYDEPGDAQPGVHTTTNGAPAPAVGQATVAAAVKAAEHRSDVGNARRLVSQHGSDLRYCYALRRWYCWDGTRWAEDQTGEVERRAKRVIRGLWKEAADATADPDEQKRRQAHALLSEREAAVKSMIALARSEPGIAVTADELDTNPWLLNCANGTVDLRTGDLQPHRREDLLTKLVPVAFDLHAPAPRWERFLEQVMPDPDVRAFLQLAAGYSATGLARDRIVLILYGTGRNGKSLFLTLLHAALGEYALVAPASTFMEQHHGRSSGGVPNDLARLKGARLVSSSETSEAHELNEAAVKAMTGDAMITARFMRAEWFDFRPAFTPWITTNHKPTIKGTDEGIWDRVMLVPFAVRFWLRAKGETGPPELEADTTLEAVLCDELPGVLAWIVAGALAWQTVGLQTPPAVQAATRRYRADMDTLQAFLDDCCTVGVQETATARELHAEYARWAKEGGEEALSSRAIATRLTARGFVQWRTKNTRWWKGVSVNPANP